MPKNDHTLQIVVHVPSSHQDICRYSRLYDPIWPMIDTIKAKEDRATVDHLAKRNMETLAQLW